MCVVTPVSSLPKIHNILVTARTFSDINFVICIFNEKGEYVVYNSAVDINRVFQKYMKKFL